MIELPDDELDKLFRKSAEEFDPAFDPQDWNALKKRLEEEDGNKPAFFWLRKWWPLVLAGLLFLGGAGLYFGLKDNDRKVADESKVREVKNKSLKSVEADSSQVISQEEVAEKKEIITQTKSVKKMPRSESKASGVFLESGRSEHESGTGAILLSKQKNSESSTIAHVKKAARPTAEAISAESQLTTVPVSNVSSILKEANEDLISKPDLARSVFAVEEIKPLPFVYTNRLSIGGPSIPPVEKDSKSAEEESEAVKTPYPRFAVRFGVSPDFSSVQFMKGTRVGNAVSLMGEYAIFRRLYLQAGVIRSVKKYVANQGYYKWPGNWTQPVMPESVDAICKIVELPINLRFDLYSNDRNRWFVGAGTSSYQMRDEQYEYNYKKHVPGIKWYNWQGETGWYWFSHLNASMGYEYRLSKSLSIMAEPYVTVPIKKVGFGQVNLFTTGVWISLRYFPFQK